MARTLFPLVLLVGACGSVTYGTRDEAFGAAVQATLDGESLGAAQGAHVFLSSAANDDPRYDRAQILLAQASEALGLGYAASLLYLDVASSRRDVDQLDKAFAGLERIVMGPTPFDEPTLVDGFLATAHITGLSPERQAFIDYLQGRHSLKQGLDAWADKQLAAIAPRSPYRSRADYVKAVRLLQRGELKAAKKALTKLLERHEEVDDVLDAVPVPEDVVVDTRLALARLAMERERYDEAVGRYEQVRSEATRRPELLLEMAWAHYYRGDSRRALGLLIALDAPVYGGLIAPERYLLEARVLRRLCQFEPARTAARRLEHRHGRALSELHAGIAPEASEALIAGARQRGQGRAAARFVRRLEKERALVESDSGALGSKLSTTLLEVYDLGLQEARRRERAALEAESLRLSHELLMAEDGVRLTLHELSVGLLRGRRRPRGPEELSSFNIEAGGGSTVYRFIGEFWTDELDDMVVLIDDRCIR
ncbi:MAG: hypothetical protein OXU20_01170 [Myxococcales bacterium]|nr:hypothetical protein [Myxococcales bacterium]MDD9965314.1 hypothetical protein [Myxococcales bacterium]